MVKSRYIGDGHPTFIRNPYNGYINPYYWVDDHPLLYGNNGSLDPVTYNRILVDIPQLTSFTSSLPAWKKLPEHQKSNMTPGSPKTIFWMVLRKDYCFSKGLLSTNPGKCHVYGLWLPGWLNLIELVTGQAAAPNIPEK